MVKISFNHVSVILFAVYYYVWQIRIVGLAFKDASGLWNEDFWKPYIGLIFNIFVNIFTKYNDAD